MGLGLWLVPYLIRYIGITAYGLIPVAGILTEYVGLISQSISIAVNRFLTIALQQNDLQEANRVFSTAFFTYMFIGLAQVPFFWLMIKYISGIITIPDELYQDAIILLVCSAATFVINLVTSVFSVSMYANNRLDILRSIDIGRYLLRVGGIVTLFTILGPTLRYVGYVDLTISVIIFMVQSVISKRLVPALRLRLHYYDWNKIHQLVGMGGWLLINNIGTVLFLRIDIWVCNRFISPESAGEYAAVLQWPTLIRYGGSIIATVVAPMVVIYFARSEMAEVIRLSKASVRMLSLAVAVPIGIMCVLGSSILRLWLGESFTHLAPLMAIMLFHLVINVGVMPLFNVQVAMNRVSVPAVVTLLMGVLNLVLAIFFVTYFKWGVYGVAIAGAIVLTAKNAFWTPIYTAVIMHEPWYIFVRAYLSAFGLFLGLTMGGYVFSWYVVPDSFLSLILMSMVIGVIGSVAAWLLLPDGDRRVVIAMLPGRGDSPANGRS